MRTTTAKIDEQGVAEGVEGAEGAGAVRRRCAECFRGARLPRTLAVCACLAVVAQQVVACVRKLTDVPVTTHTHFDFNKTVAFPSLTFCREPPYNNTKMMEFGLWSHPRYTSTWRGYNYSHPLDRLWRDITYEPADYFVQYGLDGLADNVEITETLGFVSGRCYTLRARGAGRAGRAHGYSVTLQHSLDDVAASSGLQPPGYHLYLHYDREPYTEVEVYNGGLVEYLYANTGETLDVKLTVHEYLMVSDRDAPCTNHQHYSANKCTEARVWEEVERAANCSGPWMRSRLPRCHDYQHMKTLIATYLDKYVNHAVESCPRICRALLYNAFVSDRQKYYTWDSRTKTWASLSTSARLQTQVYVHFNNMMVSVFEEQYNYDWNMFLSDLGGSVGFLLGLSVLGVISILGDAWTHLLRPLLCPRRPATATATATNEKLAKY